MRQEIRNKHLHIVFDSLEDYIASSLLVPPERGQKTIDRSFAFGDNYDGQATLEAAMAMARKGSVKEGLEGIAFAEDKIAEMQRDLIKQGFQWRYSDDTGSEIDVARYISGDDDYLVEFYLDDMTIGAPVVTLVIGSAVSCCISSSAIREHGKRLVALVDAIESTGKTVELWIDYLHADNYNASGNARTARQSILLKAPGQFLDAGQMFHALTDSSMFRVIGFNAVGHYPDAWFNVLNENCSYGCCVLKSELHEPQDYPEGTTYIKPLNRDSEAKWSVETTLKDLGLWRVGDGNQHRDGCECIECKPF
jgi:hypothetical protein